MSKRAARKGRMHIRMEPSSDNSVTALCGHSGTTGIWGAQYVYIWMCSVEKAERFCAHYSQRWTGVCQTCLHLAAKKGGLR